MQSKKHLSKQFRFQMKTELALSPDSFPLSRMFDPIQTPPVATNLLNHTNIWLWNISAF